MRQVAAALASVHATGLVHGDLKLKNVVRVVGADGNRVLKLIDFDAAVEFGGVAGAKTSTGVCPPELFDPVPPHPVRNDLAAAASFDVWSFGVVLYTLLAGGSLFRVDRDDNVAPRDELTNLAVWSEVQLDSVLSQSQIQSPDAKVLLKQLLHPDPARRPTMRTVLEHGFFNIKNVIVGSVRATSVISRSEPAQKGKAWVCYGGFYFTAGSGDKESRHDEVYAQNPLLELAVGTADDPRAAVMDCTQGGGGELARGESEATKQRQAQYSANEMRLALWMAKELQMAENMPAVRLVVVAGVVVVVVP